MQRAPTGGGEQRTTPQLILQEHRSALYFEIATIIAALNSRTLPAVQKLDFRDIAPPAQRRRKRCVRPAHGREPKRVSVISRQAPSVAFNPCQCRALAQHGE